MKNSSNVRRRRIAIAVSALILGSGSALVAGNAFAGEEPPSEVQRCEDQLMRLNNGDDVSQFTFDRCFSDKANSDYATTPDRVQRCEDQQMRLKNGDGVHRSTFMSCFLKPEITED